MIQVSGYALISVAMQPEGYNYQQPVYTPLTDPSRRRQRILVGIIIAGFVGIVLIGVFNVISSRNNPANDYAVLAADNNELLRIIKTHEDKAGSLDLRNYLSRAELLIASSRNDLRSFLATRYNVSVSEQQVALSTDLSIDEQLESAATANRFDEDFTRLFDAKIDAVELQATLLREGTNDPQNIATLDSLLTVYESLEL